MKNYVMGDFGSPITKKEEGMGLALNDIFASVFGTEGAEQVKATLKAGATSTVTNIVGKKLSTDAEAKKSIVDTAKSTVSELYQEYKVPVLIVGGGVALLAGLGLYNTFKKK